ncbi:short transient receptor potential channel 4-like [Anneissia japonica]|uniref:short transient receptor potential channel 4-like n=1 Tax=Anneissia japonica TaxID=1529436 RepID=UPI00142558C6|nr:short transient receptor potential channel 4-like [Anneissia japonica]
MSEQYKDHEHPKCSDDIELHTLRRLTSRVVKPVLETDPSLEEIFLRAAEKGDLEAVNYALLHKDSFDIKCLDKNGDSALQLAIRNSNAEVVKVMLEGGIHPGDSLLRAVDRQNLKIVDIILNFANSPKGREHDIINSGTDSDDFHPVVTPLMLAAQNNNHDIIRTLILNGAKLIDDPGIPESSENCHTVEYSLGILQIYRALSGEFYIALTSKDPIETSFSLCRRLKKLEDKEYEFRTEYEELQTQVEKFSASLLDQLRGSNELETVLTHNLRAWEEDYTTVSDNQLLKLQMAIEHKQKEFVAHPNCQLILTKRWYEGLPSGWRDYSVIRDLIGSLIIGCSYPLFSILYICYPFGWIKKFVSSPHAKYIVNVVLSGTYVLTDDQWVIGSTLSDNGVMLILLNLDVWAKFCWFLILKKSVSCAYQEPFFVFVNLLQSHCSIVQKLIARNISPFQILRESDSYYTKQEQCHFLNSGPPCFGDYYSLSNNTTCCDPEYSLYNDCLNRQCNDGTMYDGEKCVKRYLNTTMHRWLTVPAAILCPTDTAWDGEKCRQLPECQNDYVLYGSLFSCCLMDLDNAVCVSYRCVKDGKHYDYDGEQCYLYEEGSYVVYSNASLPKHDIDMCEESDDYNLALQTLEALLRNCGGQPVDQKQLKDAIDGLITPEPAFGYLEVDEKFDIRKNGSLKDTIHPSLSSLYYEEYQSISEYFLNKYSFRYSRSDWNYADPNLIAEAMFAIGNICSFLRLLLLIAVSRSVGPLEISLERMYKDIGRFLLIFIVIWWAFTMGMTQLYYPYASGVILECIENGGQQSECLNSPFASFFKGMETLFWGLVGLGDLSILETNTDHVITEGVGTFMYATYTVMAVIVLLNLLIAMLSNTFSRVEDNSDIEWKFSRSAIWIGYFDKQVELPIPFNILPTPKHIFDNCRSFLNMCCFHKAEKELKRKYKEKIKKKNQEYQEVMDNLVARYIADKRSSAFDTDDAVTQSDVIDIRSDVSDLRNEVLELFRNVEGAISNCIGTCDEIFDSVMDFGDALDILNGREAGDKKVVKKRENRNKNLSKFQEKLITQKQPDVHATQNKTPTALKRRTRIVEHQSGLDATQPEDVEGENEEGISSFFQKIGNLLV